MLVNVNGIYYAHVCEQACWAHSAGNSAIENLCIIIIYYKSQTTIGVPQYQYSNYKKWSLQYQHWILYPQNVPTGTPFGVGGVTEELDGAE